MTFVNVNKIFAEICTNRKIFFRCFDEGKEKILNFTFEEDCIVLQHKTELHYFPYDKNGAKNLESFIEELDDNIEFKVLKMHKSYIANDTSLVNDSIYDEKIKVQLGNIQNSSLWNYVKKDLVKLESNENSYTTLEDFINNSITYGKTLQFVIKHAVEKIIYDRTTKYALLLVTYAYEAQLINFFPQYYWETFLKVCEKLRIAQFTFMDYDELSSYLEYLNREKHDEKRRMYKLKVLIKEFASHFFTPEELTEYNFEVSKDSKSNDSNTHILPQDVINILFNGFPEPHGDVKSYDFHLIPKSLDEIMEKLEIIFSLIHAEYNLILKIEYNNV
ncbi:uncharacterized protein LOC126906605 [Daktulosphaira vitifoliae]|uniref:uncharacterized protein LOC126906605 n=1 Tax=Daktulosphaira vitifoliae TaxID=58002 RepID=UPI0021A9BA8C|nr:uncharacterized protein LOC126906605 [Daktulosphaira vitifoliae]